MSEAAHDAVVVGFDGSQESRQAARWAAQEAATRKRRLVIVHAYVWPIVEFTPLGGVMTTEEPFREALEQQVKDLAAECERIAPGIDVTGTLIPGDPIEVLTTLSARANLLVVGSSGHGKVHEVVLGSTSAELARYAAAPLVVIRNTDKPVTHRRVVVGVDGSATSNRAVDFAFDFATRHNADLTAVIARNLPPTDYAEIGEADIDWTRIREEAMAVLSESLAGHADRYPDVTVHKVVSLDRPVQTLLENSTEADLLVVGSHGRGVIRRMLLGSTSHALLHYAKVPIAILRAQEDQ